MMSESKSKPEWLDRHPCSHCGTGYGECIQGVRFWLMCCTECKHPTRWTDEPPYTADEYEEMNQQ